MNLKKTKAAKKVQRREWTKANLKELKAHSKARASVDKISKSDQADGWRASPEGTPARDRSRTSAINARHRAACRRCCRSCETKRKALGFVPFDGAQGSARRTLAGYESAPGLA